MSRKEYHVVPRQDGWAVQREHSERASALCGTKADAVARGRELSRNIGAELVIHKQDGTIQNPNSYGNDPCPPLDRKH